MKLLGMAQMRIKKATVNHKIVDVRHVKVDGERFEKKEGETLYVITAHPASEEEITDALNKIEDYGIKKISEKFAKEIISISGGNLAYHKKTKTFYKIVETFSE